MVGGGARALPEEAEVRAVVIRSFGGPEVLGIEHVEDPVPGDGQVLIDVEVANLTFVETQVRAGTGPFPVELPLIPGNGVGGVVGVLGDGVDERWAGRRVVSSLRGSGGAAERAVADADALIEVPDTLALEDAVALLADGRTAMLQVEAAQVRAGDRVLVEAAGGGVGTLLVQLCRAAGARVIGAASRGENRDLAVELGAELAVDYTYAGWVEQVRHDRGGLDVVFDGVGGRIGREAFSLLVPGGRMSSFGAASGEWTGVSAEQAAAAGVTLVTGSPSTPAQLRAASERAILAAATGRLRPVIGQRVPWERIADAHRAIEARAPTGKTLLLL